MPDWAVQQLRVSLFSNTAVTLTETFWEAITAQKEAENRSAIVGGKVFSGNFLDGKFSVGFSQNRCDIVLAHEFQEPNEPPGEGESLPLPAFTGWKQKLDAFVTAVVPAVSSFAFPIIRLAFGIHLVSPATNKEDAYSQIGEQLRSVKIDPVKMRDLVYRVNWPRTSKIAPGLEMNRLTSWSSVNIKSGLLQLTDAGLEPNLLHPQAIDVARLEIDHSTSQSNSKPFDKAVLAPILEELVALARENADAGEVI